MQDLKQLLRNNYVEGTFFHSHVSLIHPRGKYQFNRKNIELLWSKYCDNLYHSKQITEFIYGIAEKSQSYLPILVDVDLKVERSEEFEEGLYTEDEVNSIIKIYQNVLNDIVKKIKPDDLNCIVLEKPLYYSSGKDNIQYIKNGFHLHFPSIFLSKEDQQNILIPRVKQIIKEQEIFLNQGFQDSSIVIDDAVCKVPWLLYGCRKSEDQQPYLFTRVVNNQGIDVDIEDAFINYKIYDMDEEIINITGKVEYYLPRILSIIPYGRDGNDLLKKFQISEKIVMKNSLITIDSSDDEEEEDEEEIDLENQFIFDCFYSLKTDRYEDRKKWIFTLFLGLKLGLTRSQIHDLSERAFNYDKVGTNSLIKSFNSKKTNNKFGIKNLISMLRTDNLDFLNDNKDKFNKSDLELPVVLNPIKLDDIGATEIINQNNIGSYTDRLLHNDLIVVRSNMMTCKTQNLKAIIPNHKKILIVLFRCSLGNDYMREFSNFGFKFYSDLSGEFYNADRLVVQIDSLHKVRGNYDLMVLDEFTYTLSHITNFKCLKDKQMIYRILEEYITETKKVIVLDALMDKFTTNFLYKLRPDNMLILDNKFKAFNREVIYDEVSSSDIVINKVKNMLEEGKKVCVPTNSKAFGDKLYAVCKQWFSIGYISADRTVIPTENWSEFELLIYTPTIAAGNSFNEIHYDERVSYFSNVSCNADIASQMINRVRNIKNTTEYIFVKKRNATVSGLPKSKLELEEILDNDVDVLGKIVNIDIKTTGLQLKHTRNKFIKDGYYILYLNNLFKEISSKLHFGNKLAGNLEAHGFHFRLADRDQYELDDKSLSKEDKTNVKKYKIEQLQAIVESKPLTEQELIRLSNKNQKTEEETNRILKTNFEQAVNLKSELTVETYKKVHKKIASYRRACFVKNNTNHREEIDKEIAYFKEKDKTIDKDEFGKRVEFREDSKSALKMYCCYQMLDYLGFKDPFDTETILPEMPYKKITQFIIDFGEKYNSIWDGFNRSSLDIKKLDITYFDYDNSLDLPVSGVPLNDENETMKKIIKQDEEDTKFKHQLTSFFNNKLRDTLGISISNVSKSKANLQRKYGLTRLEQQYAELGISLELNSKLPKQALYLHYKKSVISDKRIRLLKEVAEQKQDPVFLKMIGSSCTL